MKKNPEIPAKNNLAKLKKELNMVELEERLEMVQISTVASAACCFGNDCCGNNSCNC